MEKKKAISTSSQYPEMKPKKSRVWMLPPCYTWSRGLVIRGWNDVPVILTIDQSWVSLSCQSWHVTLFWVPEMTENHLWEQIFEIVLWLFVQSTNMKELGFMTDTAASHQVAIKMLWLHFWGASMSSIFRSSLWDRETRINSKVSPHT